MSNDGLQQLKALALAATPGPWEVDTVRSDGEYGSDDDGGYGFDSYQITTDTGACIADCLNNDVGAVHVENDGRAWDKVAKQDAQYIAAASPDVVLALVAEVEQLRAALATPPVASGALPELPQAGNATHGGALVWYEAQMRAYGQACAAAAAPNAALVGALTALLGLIDEFGIRSGVCCCGDGMARHDNPMDCGHSPVDSGEYYSEKPIEFARAALAQAGAA